MNRNAERGHVTRERVLAVATRLFATHGYDGTSIDTVLRESAVSKGSLYHHFNGKDALFGAVLEQVQQRVGTEVAEAGRRERDPVAALRAGCLAWIRLAGDPVVRQVLLLDAPAVLGWQRWRALDDEHTLGQVKAALARAADAGRLERRHVDVFAHVVLAAVNEVALLVARSPDGGGTLPDGEAAITEILRRLLPDERTT